MKILAISGSLRDGSYNTMLLGAAADAAPEGVELELFDPVGIAELPLYDQDLDQTDPPESVIRRRRRSRDCATRSPAPTASSSPRRNTTRRSRAC